MSKTAIAIVLAIAILAVIGGGIFAVYMIAGQSSEEAPVVLAKDSEVEGLKMAKAAAEAKAAQAQAQLSQLQSQIGELEDTISNLEDDLEDQQSNPQPPATTDSTSDSGYADLSKVTRATCSDALGWVDDYLDDLDNDIEDRGDDLDEEQDELSIIQTELNLCNSARTNYTTCANTANPSSCLTSAQTSTCGTTLDAIDRSIKDLKDDERDQDDRVEDVDDEINDLEDELDEAEDLERDIKSKCRSYGITR